MLVALKATNNHPLNYSWLLSNFVPLIRAQRNIDLDAQLKENTTEATEILQLSDGREPTVGTYGRGPSGLGDLFGGVFLSGQVAIESCLRVPDRVNFVPASSGNTVRNRLNHRGE